MDDECDFENAWARLRWRTNKAAQRDQKEECLGAGFKMFICTLVFLEVPWTIIGAIAVAKLKTLKRSRSSPDWPTEKIRRLAREGLKLRPNLPSTIDEPHNEIVQRARKWVAECKLACWCLEQNLKGISVPASLAIDHYLSLWGQAPHTERVSKHLNQFVEPSKWKKWMQHFKQTWDFRSASCSRGPLLTPEQTTAKARQMMDQKPEKAQEQLVFLWTPLVQSHVSVLGPRSGPKLRYQLWFLYCFVWV